jgi:hypothetical protein
MSLRSRLAEARTRRLSGGIIDIVFIFKKEEGFMKKFASVGTMVLVVAALVFMAGACGKKSESPAAAEKKDATAPKPAETETKPVVVPQGEGEWKAAGVFSFRIEGVKLIKNYDAAFSAGEGKIYVEVEYSIKNTTDAVQTFSSILAALMLADPAGKGYGPVAGLGNWIESQGNKDGKIAAKAEVKVSCLFEVPGDMSLSLGGWKFDIGNSDIEKPATVRFVLK